jgi:ATP-dependent DNA helicase Rep
MRERAMSLIGREAKDVLICTFHALGVRMLRQDGAALGLKPQFSILDSDDVTSILKDAGGTTDAATARQWQWAISLWKNMGLNAAQAEAQAKDDNERVTARVMARYEERLAAYQSVDFDDLIGLPLKLLQQHAQVREKWQQQMGHVLVDEYQDTNATQYEVLKLLVGERGRFTAVGDDDQSIYGWRGATLDNLKRLPMDFPQLKVVKLEQNYRSTSAILRAANNVIGPNPKLFPKTLYSELGEGEPVRIVDADNEEHEAERVVARIQSIRANGLSQDWKISRCCIAPTTRPGSSKRHCASADPVQGVGRPELLRSRRDQGPVRLVSPVDQQRRRPGFPARRHHAQARHRPHHAAEPGHFREQIQAEPVRGAVSPRWARCCPRRRWAACMSSADT